MDSLSMKGLLDRLRGLIQKFDVIKNNVFATIDHGQIKVDTAGAEKLWGGPLEDQYEDFMKELNNLAFMNDYGISFGDACIWIYKKDKRS